MKYMQDFLIIRHEYLFILITYAGKKQALKIFVHLRE